MHRLSLCLSSSPMCHCLCHCLCVIVCVNVCVTACVTVNRTAVNAQSGVKTQLGGVFTGLFFCVTQIKS